MLIFLTFAQDLTPPAYVTLAGLNPNLTHLHLDLCGRLDSSVMEAFSQGLPHLTSLRLVGPFLVRAEAWIEFFRAKPDLRSFCITTSPRFNLSCVEELARNCTQLEELQLKEVGQLDDTFVEAICALPPLKVLDLSLPTSGIEEAGWMKVLARHGGTLEVFDPSWHAGFTGDALYHGLRKHVRVLSELRLAGCEGLDDESICLFFQNKRIPGTEEEMTEECLEDDLAPLPPLHKLSLTRNKKFSDESIRALVDHSGSTLVSLDLNSIDTASTDALVSLRRASGLRRLDLSWCRSVDDFVMKDIVWGMPRLEEVRVWGCNRVSGMGWRKVRSLLSMNVRCVNDGCRED